MNTMQSIPTHTHKSLNVLRVDASARRQESASRALGDEILAALDTRHGDINLRLRDLSEGLPFVTEDWVAANFTEPKNRIAAHHDALALSDDLVEELKAADVVIIATPIYNFGVPAALKAWVDMVARARLTFRFTETGAVGLLEGKRAYLAVASGGTAVDSDIDFATPYLRHMLGFLGISEVETVAADRLMLRGPEGLEEA
ncbi:MAG: NAD(P)H-dependent oxidoreductase, partial [Pseudomonadota bacterium]